MSQVFKTFIQMIKNQFETTIKRVCSNNAKDFFNQTLSSFNEQGIIYESSCVNTPQQNGMPEQKIRHLINVTLPLFTIKMYQNSIGEKFSFYLFGPIQLLFKFFPDFRSTNNLAHRVFGCVSFVHVHPNHRGKLALENAKSHQISKKD